MGIHYGATKFTLKYMARNEAIPAQNAIMGQRATNLMLVDSSQDGVDEAEAMMKQVLLDMKVPTATVDLAKNRSRRHPLIESVPHRADRHAGT